MWFGRFSKATDQQVWENYDDRWREPEGLLPDSGLYPPSGGNLTQTGEPRGLLPSGGDFAAKPHVSLRPCAAPPRSPKGAQPPSGGNSAVNLLSLEYPRALWAR